MSSNESMNTSQTAPVAYAPRRCQLSSFARFTLFSSVVWFCREFLTISAFAFTILIGILLIARDVSAQFTEACHITHRELLTIVFVCTAIVYVMLAAVTMLVRWYVQPREPLQDEESKPIPGMEEATLHVAEKDQSKP